MHVLENGNMLREALRIAHNSCDTEQKSTESTARAYSEVELSAKWKRWHPWSLRSLRYVLLNGTWSTGPETSGLSSPSPFPGIRGGCWLDKGKGIDSIPDIKWVCRGGAPRACWVCGQGNKIRPSGYCSEALRSQWHFNTCPHQVCESWQGKERSCGFHSGRKSCNS